MIVRDDVTLDDANASLPVTARTAAGLDPGELTPGDRDEGKDRAPALRTASRPGQRGGLVGLLDRVGSIPFAAALLLLIFLYSSVGSAVPPVRQGALADWLGIELLRFEKSEMEWFCWWPFRLLIGLFCFALVTASVRRVPFKRAKAGVWLAHGGMLTMVVSSAIYFGAKVEGDAVVFASRALILAPGMTEPAELVIRPEASTMVEAGGRRYAISVARIIPDDVVAHGPRRGQQDLSIRLRVRSTGPDQDFTRVLYLGGQGEAFDVPTGGSDAASAGGLVDTDLQIALDYDPAQYFYHSHQPPVRSVGAIYARPVGARQWTELRVHGMPHYYEWLTHRAEVWPAVGEDWPPPRPLDLAAEVPADAQALAGLSFRVTDYLPYAQFSARWVSGGSEVNPLLRFTMRSGSVDESYELRAFDPAVQRRLLTDQFPAELIWTSGAAEREALLRRADPHITVRVGEMEEAISFPLSELMGKATEIAGTEYRVELRQVVPAGALDNGRSPPLALVHVQKDGEDFKSFMRVLLADAPNTGPDLDERLRPTGRSEAEDLELAYHDPIAQGLRFVVGPDGDEVDVVMSLSSGSYEHRRVRTGEPFELVEGVELTVTEWWPRARQEGRPALVPRHQRLSLSQVGKTRSLVRVEVQQGHEMRSVWLPFCEYAFPDDQRAQPQRFFHSTGRVTLPDGRAVELLYSRWRDPLPAAVVLDRFMLQTYPGGDRPRDYISLVRFQENGDWSAIREVRSNQPVRHADLWFFQAQWDPSNQCHTVLGVGNRRAVHGMLAGAMISVAGLIQAFYVQPVLARRKRERLAKVGEGGHG